MPFIIPTKNTSRTEESKQEEVCERFTGRLRQHDGGTSQNTQHKEEGQWVFPGDAGFPRTDVKGGYSYSQHPAGLCMRSHTLVLNIVCEQVGETSQTVLETGWPHAHRGAGEGGHGPVGVGAERQHTAGRTGAAPCVSVGAHSSLC